MKKIGITGQQGFIGGHLYNSIRLHSDEFELIIFNADFFHNEKKLKSFVKQCDVIVHLAAKNRHSQDDVLYDTNIGLTHKLVKALTDTGSKAHIIFSSSIQEDNGSVYGRSKTDSRKSLIEWSNSSGGNFTGLIIPNVFGPFGNPYYNSVIATFCYQLINEKPCSIQVDSSMRLIYISELINRILDVIRNEVYADFLVLEHSKEIKVTNVLKILNNFKECYIDRGEIPFLNSDFELNLFNTFRSYIDIKKYFPRKYIRHIDDRGVFSELIRLNIGGQVSYSETLSEMTRGNHFHTRKIERFSVIKGEALIQLRRVGTDEIINLKLSGSEPAYVDMSVWYTHNIKNVGKESLLTVFWISEFYDPQDPDTYFEIV